MYLIRETDIEQDAMMALLLMLDYQTQRGASQTEIWKFDRNFWDELQRAVESHNSWFTNGDHTK